MKLCINCYTENTDDVVFCSKCGMSLIGAPTGGEAMKILEEAAALEEKRRKRRLDDAQRPLQQRLTASGIVYVYGHLFAPPWDPAEALALAGRFALSVAMDAGIDDGRIPAWLPYSGQPVPAGHLGPKLLEAAFVSLAQEGYISLWLDDKAGLLVPEEAVSIGQERSRDDLPLSLERSITGALAPAPQRHWLKSLVPWLGHGLDPLTTAVDIVAEALIQTGWLQRGVVGGKSVHRNPTEEAARLLAAMTGEAETVKARLESFATQTPRLHAQLMEELEQPA